jgi:L-fucose isomerase
MDMDPLRPKAVWGFNGTERPGAVYLAAVLAGHAQKGLPAFGIYGRDVQEAGDLKIPAEFIILERNEKGERVSCRSLVREFLA